MEWARGKLSALVQTLKSDRDPASSNIKMLLIAAAFLLVTIGLIVLQPGVDTGYGTHRADVAPEPAPLESVASIEPEVTRADASLLSLNAPQVSEAVSKQLRQPIRLTDTDARHNDLRALTAITLAGFGYTPAAGDRLQILLVQALTEGQSNAYIDALLNTAAARGEFEPPRQLMLSSGRMDTDALLAALVHNAKG
ncbi:MAG: hypothetical protein AAF214_11830 [Pseudomonadota bacterium]